MSVSDFLQLPPAARILFAVMLWPAVWAAVLLLTAFVDDFQRRRTRRYSAIPEKTHDGDPQHRTRLRSM
jgi:hypothetical protein